MNECCIVNWNGEEDSIFRLKSLCVGNEVGFYYTKLVVSSKVNFSSFCDSMTYNYQVQSDDKFMDAKSFRDWWFSWASHQDIEFREQCQWCGNEPTILACDGTKIGITSSSCKIDPVEKKDKSGEISTISKRLDRCFIHGGSKELREHLRFLCQGNNISQDLTGVQLMQKTISLLEHIPDECLPLFNRFIKGSISARLADSTRQLFYNLSYDAPLRALIPLELVSHFEKLFCCLSQNSNNIFEVINELIRECGRLSPVVGRFIDNLFTEDRLSYDSDGLRTLLYLTNQLKQYELTLVDVPAPQSILNSYNPPKLGRAYYFRHDGCQIRQFRTFTVDERSSTIDAADHACRKKFPVVTTKASTFLFLWFCPIHGHCYGFHIVNGSEGRKDPPCSLFNHLEKPPSIIYYDFACSLEEYFLNRENGYVKNTRFYHDIFHSYNHKCSSVYKSQNMKGLDYVNSSICEQFNSYLQCIKSSARNMSQIRFMFYVQYMISLWNEQKKVNYQKKLRTAIKGTYI